MDQTEKPIPLVVVAQNIPQTLKDRPQWVLWRYDWRNNKWTKPPYQPTDRLAKTNDPATWSPFDTVYGAYQSGGWDGLGVCFSKGDGLTGLDLDHCYNDGLNDQAKEIVERFKGTAYVELSPSGEGVRIFAQGTPQRSGKGNGSEKWIEVYSHPSSRYLTITGQTLIEYSGSIGDGQEALDWLHGRYFAKPDSTEERETRHSPCVVDLNDSELLDKARHAANGQKFHNLFTGSETGDHSANDLALCGMLAFWTQDPQQIDRLFRQSGLMRPKWDEKHGVSTYGATTIVKAMTGVMATYQTDGKKKTNTAGKEKAEKKYQVKGWDSIRANIGIIQWDWEKWLPKGLLTLIASAPGIGKSAICLRVAQTFIQGILWPDGTAFTGATGSVLWCEAESAEAINLGRAEKWAIPMDRLLDPLGCDPPVAVCLGNPEHRKAVKEAAMLEPVRLIVVDSLRGSFKGNESSSESIDVVMWLASLARDIGKPILLTHHLRKRGVMDGDDVSLDRLRGSSAIAQPARIVWSLDAPIPTDPNSKRLCVIKSNISRFPEPIGFTVDETGVHFMKAPNTPKSETMLDKAKELLLSLLAQQPVQYNIVLDDMEAHGVSKNTLYRAKDALKIVVYRDGRKSFWSLPTGRVE